MATTLEQLESFVKKHKHFQDLSTKLLEYLILSSENYPDYVNKMYGKLNEYHEIYDTLKPFQELNEHP